MTIKFSIGSSTVSTTLNSTDFCSLLSASTGYAEYMFITTSDGETSTQHIYPSNIISYERVGVYPKLTVVRQVVLDATISGSITRMGFCLESGDETIATDTDMQVSSELDMQIVVSVSISSFDNPPQAFTDWLAGVSGAGDWTMELVMDDGTLMEWFPSITWVDNKLQFGITVPSGKKLHTAHLAMNGELVKTLTKYTLALNRGYDMPTNNLEMEVTGGLNMTASIQNAYTYIEKFPCSMSNIYMEITGISADRLLPSRAGFAVGYGGEYKLYSTSGLKLQHVVYSDQELVGGCSNALEGSFVLYGEQVKFRQSGVASSAESAPLMVVQTTDTSGRNVYDVMSAYGVENWTEYGSYVSTNGFLNLPDAQLILSQGTQFVLYIDGQFKTYDTSFSLLSTVNVDIDEVLGHSSDFVIGTKNGITYVFYANGTRVSLSGSFYWTTGRLIGTSSGIYTVKTDSLVLISSAVLEYESVSCDDNYLYVLDGDVIRRYALYSLTNYIHAASIMGGFEVYVTKFDITGTGSDSEATSLTMTLTVS